VSQGVGLRFADAADVPVLARLNRQLIEDEGHPNPMDLSQLADRMAGWLAGAWRAVLFEREGEVVAYALYGPDEQGIYLRQFFVARAHRRLGIGRDAVARLRAEVLGPDTVVTLGVLAHNERGLAFWRAVGFADHAIELRAGGR